MAILSFADAETEDLFYGRRVRGVGTPIARQARLRMVALHGAPTLGALASPGADLKQLKGTKALWQMRVNQQYRLRFIVVRDPPLDVADVWFGDPH
ncbi:MAG: type II toxin-antitoxin system RelE/ParE family toxin [Alphaproteobacteria bacterium]|nr:type II toxin-antitoxin system RelE/ParE family toxin [Alphaproteobacteria bacterium]